MWIDLWLNNCVFGLAHNKPQNNFKKKLQNKKQVEIKASWNWMELGKNLYCSHTCTKQKREAIPIWRAKQNHEMHGRAKEQE